MARTIAQIKEEMTSAFMNDSTLAEQYGFTEGASWSKTFSAVSIENLLLYIVAAAIWALEVLMDKHTQEIEEYIAQMKPHSLRWYVRKAKAYRHGQLLIDGTDTYPDMSEEDIEAAEVVKFAAATEASATVYIKVATEESGKKHPLSAEQLAGFREYLAEVKDAGVRVDIINEAASGLRLNMDVYYNPMILSSQGINHSTGEDVVKQTIERYISNLPFNGEFRSSSLVDALQAVDGVVIPELTSAFENYDGRSWRAINAKSQPYSGYYEYNEDNIQINYIAYESVSN